MYAWLLVCFLLGMDPKLGFSNLNMGMNMQLLVSMIFYDVKPRVDRVARFDQ